MSSNHFEKGGGSGLKVSGLKGFQTRVGWGQLGNTEGEGTALVRQLEAHDSVLQRLEARFCRQASWPDYSDCISTNVLHYDDRHQHREVARYVIG